jgi:hypothetical protein
MLSHGGRSVPGYALAGYGLGDGWQLATDNKVNPGEWFAFAFAPSDAKGGHGTNGSWTDADVTEFKNEIRAIGMDWTQNPPIDTPAAPSGDIIVKGKNTGAAPVDVKAALSGIPVAVMTMKSADAAAAKSNTMLYVYGGVAAVVLLGGVYYMMRK